MQKYDKSIFPKFLKNGILSVSQHVSLSVWQIYLDYIS